ncbi:MAG: histidinol-phosphate transaminase [Fimbriimonadaceae bacterium]|nr:histidinol-phosphate transaminase [Fimbriimonadaceae bacterium]
MAIAIRPQILRMEPYAPGRPVEEVQREFGLDRVIKLASNENPFGPSPRAIAAVTEAAARMHIYPDGASRALRQAISQKFGVTDAHILLGNGSDELIHILGVMFLGEPGDELIMGDPGFSRYDASAHLAGCRLVKVPLRADLTHDLDAMLAAITPRTRMVFIANPNNPTGTVITRAEFDPFLARVPDGVVVVLDEAYGEYAADAPDPVSALDYVRSGAPVIGLRTFSKAYGLAGIRVGFGFAPAEVVDAYHRAREPFNVNSLAQVAAIAALEDEDHIAESVAHNHAGLQFLAEVFCAAEAHPYRSFANFAYADLGRPAQPVFEALLRRGVIVRSGSHVGHPHCLRVSVGRMDELEIFATEFRQVLDLI